MMKRLVSLFLFAALLVSAAPLSWPAAAEAVEITQEQYDLINKALEDDSKELPVGEEFRILVDPSDLSIVKGLNPDWVNILVLGTDTGGRALNYGRTDAMIIASVNAKTGQMKLTSLVRDMFVQIPGLMRENRINTANAFGGPLLAMKTVNEVLGLNIDRYCSINFRGFSSLVDYLGGVELTLSASEATIVQALHVEGPQVLNGTQALDYVRIRKTDNNFLRNERQRKLLSSLLDKIKKSNMDVIMGAVAEAFKTIATNLTTAEVIALLPAVISNVDALDMLSLPQEGAFKYHTTEWGAAVVLFDSDKVKEAFHSFVYGQ